MREIMKYAREHKWFGMLEVQQHFSVFFCIENIFKVKWGISVISALK